MKTVTKKTEMTQRDALLEELRVKLMPRGYKIYNDVSIKLLSGKTRFPDIIVNAEKLEEYEEFIHILPQGVEAIIETKRSSEEDLTKGSNQCRDYLQAYSEHGLLGKRLGFTTNFKRVYKRYSQIVNGNEYSELDVFPLSDKKRISIVDIVDYISQDLINPPKEIRKTNVETLIQYIKEPLDLINKILNKTSILEIQNILKVFEISYDKELFENPGKIENTILNAASFVLINQLIFYAILSTRLKIFPNLRNVTSVHDLRRNFDNVLEIDYAAIYEITIIDKITEENFPILREVINYILEIPWVTIEGDILGKIFHNLIPFDLRKRIAAYYTSIPAANLLALMTIRNGDELLLDPSSGSGGLLTAGYQQKKRLIYKDHNKLLSEIYGFDISFFAAHLSVVNLSLQDINSSTDTIFVTVGDFFNQTPNEYTHSLKTFILSNDAVGEQISLDGRKKAEYRIPLFDVILSNPPFTRIERLEPKYKELLIGSHKNQGVLYRYREFLQQGGLHIGFIIHCLKFLKKNGKIGFVLPSATFSSNYGRLIEKFILENFHIDYLITYSNKMTRTTFSEDCAFKEVLMLATKKNKPSTNDDNDKYTNLITINEELTEINVPLIYELIKKNKNSQLIKIDVVHVDELQKEWNWMLFFRSKILLNAVNILKGSKRIRNCSEILKFTEGYNIQAIDFFRIPNKEWKITENSELYIKIKSLTKEIFVPKKYLIPSLGKTIDHEKVNTKPTCYILSITPEEVNKLGEGIKEYIHWGENLEKRDPKNKTINNTKIKRYTNSNRPWYTYYGEYIRSKQFSGSLAIIQKMNPVTRENFILFAEEPFYAPDSYFLIGIKDDNKQKLKIIAAWLTSSLFLGAYQLYRREISGDYGRVKITDLQDYPCIDLDQLTNDQQEAICKVFDDYCDKQKYLAKSFVQQMHDHDLKELDLLFTEILNIQNPEKYLEDLYASIEESTIFEPETIEDVLEPE